MFGYSCQALDYYRLSCYYDNVEVPISVLRKHAPIAQRIEQLSSKQLVAGSSPAGRALEDE